MSWEQGPPGLVAHSSRDLFLQVPWCLNVGARPRASSSHTAPPPSLLRGPRRGPCLVTSTAFPPRPPQDKGWSPQQVFPSGFYYKEGSVQSIPVAIPAQALQWRGLWAAGGHWRREQRRRGFLRGAGPCQSCPASEQSSPVWRRSPSVPSQVLCTGGSCSQLVHDEFNIEKLS